jgi:multiple sugar transport system permease protein
MTPRRRARSSSKTHHEAGTLLLFVVPAALVILVAQAFPVLYSLQMSFRDWALVSSTTPGGFVGFANYAKAFHDPVFLHAFLVSLQFCLAATVLEVVLGFLLAYFTVGETRFLRVARTILILPMVIAPVANGTIWRMILNPKYGLLNAVLSLVGLRGPDWLGNPTLALVSVIAMDIWQWTPFAMVVFVAGFSLIPQELHDAAQVDGASRPRILRSIIIPYLVPVIFIVLLFRIVDTFLVIDAVYTTTFGGPGFSTNVVTLYVYWQALRYFNISFASALSWMISVLTLAAAFTLMREQRRLRTSLWGTR